MQPDLSQEKPIKVLFVCTGNICRSPTAEAFFRHLVLEGGLEGFFEIDSAGTHGYHIGEPPDPRAIHTLLSMKGVDMGGLKARKVVADDFQRFSYILAMDEGHYETLAHWPVGARKRALEAEGKPSGLALFLPFSGIGPLSARNVPDPYYGGPRDFEETCDLIARGCEGLMNRLKKLHGLP